MAPAKAAIKNAQNAHNVQAGLKPDEKRMIYSILANLEGQIDFKAVAADIEAVNAEAVYV